MTFVEPVANALCLELVNTVDNWPEPRRDALATPADAVDWAGVLGIAVEPPPAVSALDRARALRAQVRAVFGALAASEEPRAADLAALHRSYAAALDRARLDRVSTVYAFSWPDPGSLDDLLGQVTASAVALLSDGPLDRVGACPSCGWLFLDTSRNGRRRWCSMATCGARVKARRYYAGRTGTQPATD